MAFTYVAAGTASHGTTSATPTFPVGIQAGDVCFMAVLIKESGDSIATPTGWTLVLSQSMTTAQGGSDGTADAGSNKLAVFRRICDGTEAADVTVTATGSTVISAAMYAIRPGAGQVPANTVALGAVDSSAATSYSVTFGSNHGFDEEDAIIIAVGLNGDAASFNVTPTPVSLTATGITFPAFSYRINGAGTTTGTDQKLYMFQAFVAAGTGPQTGNATFAGTLTSSTGSRGPAIVIRQPWQWAPGVPELRVSTNLKLDGTNPGLTQNAYPGEIYPLHLYPDAGPNVGGGADTVGVSDNVVTGGSITKQSAAADTVAASDAISTARVNARSAADTVGVADTASTVRTGSANIGDAISIGEAVDLAANVVRSVADPAVGVADAAGDDVGLDRSAADTVGVADAAGEDLGMARAAADNVGLADAAADDAGLARTSGDQVPVADAAGREIGAQRPGTDAAGTADAVTTAAGLGRAAGDTVGIQDSAGTVRAWEARPADFLGVADGVTVQRSGAGSATIPDVVIIGDTVVVTRNAVANAGDTVAIVDTGSTGRGILQNPADGAGVGDAVTVNRTRTPLAADVVGILDTVSVQIASEDSAADAVLIADDVTVTGARTYVVDVEDTLTVSDFVAGPPIEGPGVVDGDILDRRHAGRIQRRRHGGQIVIRNSAGRIEPRRWDG